MEVYPKDWPERYQAFLADPEVQAAIRAGDDRGFLKRYPRAINSGPPPMAALPRALSDCRVALISSGGVYVPGRHDPFAADSPFGDATARAIPTHLPLPAWHIAHGHYDPAPALEDYNVVLPLDRLRELEAMGVIGAVAPWAYSFDGFCTDVGALVQEAGRDILAGCRDGGVEAAVLVPV